MYCEKWVSVCGGTSEVNQPNSSSSSRVYDKFGWKMLWGLKIPPKIKVFGWRVIKGILPTCDNLQRKI